ncbi:MAG: dihydropteroate synthase [Verrucomicrobiota bacterium]
MVLNHARGSFKFGDRPALMGILNVTPDSFSDGGMYQKPDLALARAIEMIGKGADIIDIGGESTRPGAIPVSKDEECDRVLPVIEILHKERPDILISIDTTKATVAQKSIQSGASIINDVSGGIWDSEMIHVVRSKKAGYICMHALDRPQKMQEDPQYEHAASDIGAFLKKRKGDLMESGISEDAMCFDVGIGFGKTLKHNLQLIKAGADNYFDFLARPLLWGLSRKSFIDKLLGRNVDKRIAGSLSAYAYLLKASHPQIWRIHDLQEIADFLKMRDALESA